MLRPLADRELALIDFLGAADTPAAQPPPPTPLQWIADGFWKLTTTGYSGDWRVPSMGWKACSFPTPSAVVRCVTGDCMPRGRLPLTLGKIGWKSCSCETPRHVASAGVPSKLHPIDGLTACAGVSERADSACEVQRMPCVLGACAIASTGAQSVSATAPEYPEHHVDFRIAVEQDLTRQTRSVHDTAQPTLHGPSRGHSEYRRTLGAVRRRSPHP
jgi:hypothetical protein